MKLSRTGNFLKRFLSHKGALLAVLFLGTITTLAIFADALGFDPLGDEGEDCVLGVGQVHG